MVQIKRASEIRNASDYNDTFIALKNETQKHIEDAKVFYDKIKG